MNDQPQDFTYDLSILEKSASTWKRSPGLRYFYNDIYREVYSNCVEGPTLEVGSGIAASRSFFSNLVTSDIVKTPYVDCAMSAYNLRAGDEGLWANIFAVDVLHHLKYPMLFLKSASNVLCFGGRIILVEPAATLGGCAFFKLFHHEPIKPRYVRAPFEFESNGANGNFANMGMGVGLFKRCRSQVDDLLKAHSMYCLAVKYRDLIAYPFTGGFSKSTVMPVAAVKRILHFEKRVPQRLLRILGLRMVIVIEKGKVPKT